MSLSKSLRCTTALTAVAPARGWNGADQGRGRDAHLTVVASTSGRLNQWSPQPGWARGIAVVLQRPFPEGRGHGRESLAKTSAWDNPSVRPVRVEPPGPRHPTAIAPRRETMQLSPTARLSAIVLILAALVAVQAPAASAVDVRHIPIVVDAATEPGDGSGGGTGSSSAESLEVVGVTFDTATGQIVIEFTKNVNDASVREANQALVHVIGANGQPITAQVVMAEDRAEPGDRRLIHVILPDGTATQTVTVVLDAGITAKDGQVLAAQQSLSVDFVGVDSDGTAAGPDTRAASATTPASADTASSKGPGLWLWGVPILLVLAVGGWFLYRRARTGKSSTTPQ